MRDVDISPKSSCEDSRSFHPHATVRPRFTMNQLFQFRVFCILFAAVFCCPLSTMSAELNVLFLGDKGHHQPGKRFAQLEPVFAAKNIQLTYTEDMKMLSDETLGKYDALMLFANIDNIGESQAKSLLDYVNNGGGFVPVHCATFCFRNNPDIVALMGAQFKSHGTGIFRTEIAKPDHPIMKDFAGFESWDETYVHHLHNETNREVLEYRVDKAGKEPWTWTRTHGKGRVFYTAWGHDHRTWRNPGFTNLLERGVRWAANSDPAQAGSFLAGAKFPVPEMSPPKKDVKPFEFIDVGAKIPNYTKGASWGTQEKALSKMQKPLPAEEAIKHFATPKGFHVEVFASEPDIGKAISMAWDERGRLWLCETIDYPNELRPPGTGRDRIRICEDTDGDWKADKFTIFAENLSIPTAITCYKGGVIVQDGIQTLFLKDTDGDDVADVRKILISGWSLGDTHGGVSNFQYGMDNWIWAMQGYNFSQPKANGKSYQGFRNGFFRFKLDNNDPPNVTDLEFVRSTNNNTWGLGISEEGLIFGSTANRNPSVYMPIANRYYERVRGWSPKGLGSIADDHMFEPITENVRQMDHHGGYTAAAGHALYTGRTYPKEYWNRVAFVCGPTGHLIGSFVLEKDGTDFRSHSEFNLLASDDEWSAPIMAEVGPDGNVWVVDWYNYIVQHNPTPRGFKTGKGNAYETDLRDKIHGRIYRVVYGDQKTKPPTFDNLVDMLGSETMLWRKQAQRLLIEKGVKSAQVELLIKKAQDGDAFRKIHTLWTIEGIQIPSENRELVQKFVQQCIADPSWKVRLNAARILGKPNSPSNRQSELLSELLGDTEPLVVREALLALSDIKSSSAAGQAIFATTNLPATQYDRWLSDAAISASATHAIGFLNAALASEKPSELTVQAGRIVSEHLARNGSSELGLALEKMKTGNPALVNELIQGFLAGWPSSKKIKLSVAAEDSLESMIKNIPVNSRASLLKLASRIGSTRLETYANEVAMSLMTTVESETASEANRIKAAKEYMTFKASDTTAAAQLLNQISPQSSVGFATGILDAIEFATAKESGDAVIENLGRLTPTARKRAIRLLMGRPEFRVSLLSAIDSGKADLSDLSLDQKQTLANSNNRAIAEKAKQLMARGGALPSPDRVKVIEQFLNVTHAKGSVKNGKAIFKKHCANCHAHSGEGAEIGPDLTGMSVHPKEEMLINILDPNRSVESNFKTYKVETIEGKSFSGLLASESKTSIEIVETDGKKRTIIRDDIEELVRSDRSLMPEGFEKSMTADEMKDLLEFLADRGKFLPLDFKKHATITSALGMFNAKSAGVERLIFSDWKPKTFKGVPFFLVDPKKGQVANAIMLHGTNGNIPPKMPKQVEMPINTSAKTIHMLSGVSGWGFPAVGQKTPTVTVRLTYEDGKTEDHILRNGEHFADYIRRTDVPKSEFAFQLRGQQIRYLAIQPKRDANIKTMKLIKGADPTSPIFMAITLEGK